MIMNVKVNNIFSCKEQMYHFSAYCIASFPGLPLYLSILSTHNQFWRKTKLTFIFSLAFTPPKLIMRRGRPGNEATYCTHLITHYMLTIYLFLGARNFLG